MAASTLSAVRVADRLRVLVVDDDAEYRLIVTEVLRDAGYEVLEVPDGVAALEACRSWEPALVLVDHDMPRMTGLEFLNAKEIDSDLAGIPVVMITGSHVDVGDRVAMRLMKPVSIAKLCAAVEECAADISWRDGGDDRLSARASRSCADVGGR